MAEVALSRRNVLIGGAAAVFGLTACGRQAGPTGSAGASPRAEADPQRGGELRIPLTQEPIAPAFDMGTQAAGSVGTAALSTLAYNGLIEVEDGGKIVPQLAESWEQASPTRYVFDLRKDVTFQDGTPFDADAVKANFDRRMAPDSTAVNLPPFLEEVNVLGPHQIEFILAKPTATFVASLRRGRVMMMSPTAVEQWADTDPFRASVGTGPYQFVEYRSGDEIRLERFDEYWAETNYLDAITFKIVPSTSTQIQAFLNDEFDVIGVVPDQVSQVQRRADAVLHEYTGNTFNYLTFNQARAPFDNVDVRRGFSAAIDREGIAAGVYGGYATPASGPFSPAIGTAHQDLSDIAAQVYDPDQARQFLDSAGFDFAERIRFDAFTQDPWSKEADAIEAQLGEIGVQVGLEKQDFGSWADLIYTAKEFWMTNSGQTTRTVDPDEALYPLVHSTGDLNVSGIDDPDLDTMLDDARSESDEGIRAEMYHDIARYVADNAYAAFTVWPSEIAATSPRVQGYRFYPGGTHPVEGCWLSS
ncbi:ABC transporter substrate-binding protein [Phytoactinopolyspora alkaliphila]|uniref:ABC transporter substrate-binding protein n=1 Tax=Phytoactinopolyspora alkaliphila TaxID=1783498 RepID=A0A6N9YMX2_9ACTN|nr:ABC transporter substrate-binding protein [Phytoactinopolyspora alkaliphila]NED96287.1 ABC transporter substrate-binding protein [Phytoactinopolyspora alkaliphila]